MAPETLFVGITYYVTINSFDSDTRHKTPIPYKDIKLFFDSESVDCLPKQNYYDDFMHVEFNFFFKVNNPIDSLKISSIYKNNKQERTYPVTINTLESKLVACDNHGGLEDPQKPTILTNYDDFASFCSKNKVRPITNTTINDTYFVNNNLLVTSVWASYEILQINNEFLIIIF